MSEPLPASASAWSRWRSGRRSSTSLAGLALQTALPPAMLLAATLTLTLSANRAGAAETLFLAFWSAAVFVPLAFLESARRPLFPGLGLAVTLLVATLPPSNGLRSAAVAALLAICVLSLASLELALRPAPRLRSCAALALATALVLHGHRLYVDGLALSTLLLLGILPGLAATVAARLGAAGGPAAGRRATALALTLLLVPQLVAEPWWVGLVFATAAFSSGFGSAAAATLGHRGLFLFAAATLVAGSFPWLRGAPVATLVGAVARLDRPVAQSPLGERALVLTAASPRHEIALSGAAAGSLVVDSYLTHGVALACGQEIAALELAETPAETGRPAPAATWRAALIAGRDSAEWAAGRPDVAAQLACPAPPAWISWIPGSGRFLGQTTRARFALPQARGARRLVLTRNPGLPAETSLAIFNLATER